MSATRLDQKETCVCSVCVYRQSQWEKSSVGWVRQTEERWDTAEVAGSRWICVLSRAVSTASGLGSTSRKKSSFWTGRYQSQWLHQKKEVASQICLSQSSWSTLNFLGSGSQTRAVKHCFPWSGQTCNSAYVVRSSQISSRLPHQSQQQLEKPFVFWDN